MGGAQGGDDGDAEAKYVLEYADAVDYMDDISKLNSQLFQGHFDQQEKLILIEDNMRRLLDLDLSEPSEGGAKSRIIENLTKLLLETSAIGDTQVNFSQKIQDMVDDKMQNVHIAYNELGKFVVCIVCCRVINIL